MHTLAAWAHPILKPVHSIKVGIRISQQSARNLLTIEGSINIGSHRATLYGNMAKHPGIKSSYEGNSPKKENDNSNSANEPALLPQMNFCVIVDLRMPNLCP